MVKSDIRERSPIVTIMGHIDHGKTTLLDYIRSSSITKREAGGITQHLGSYQILYKKSPITFIDTPGHEAFKSIRSRGVKTADVILIIVAGDEGVKPQTVEAIELAKSTKLPIIVVITKIDKPNLNIEKIKTDLSEYGLLSEEWGGDIIFTEVSSTTGKGIDNLLEMILLVTEIAEIKANYSQEYADGFILESFLDSKVGPLSDIVVLNGTLRIGDILMAGDTTYGKIKRIQNDKNELVKEALPGQPVRVLGIKGVTNAGDNFKVVESENAAIEIIEKSKAVLENNPVIQSLLEKEKELNLILKADSMGSLDAIEYALNQIVQIDMKINILGKGIGDVNASDLKQARTQKAFILAFGLKQDKKIKAIAEEKDVLIKHYRLIYELIDEIRDILSKTAEPKISRNEIGELRVLKVFKDDKKNVILGGKVVKDKILRNALVEMRDSEGKVFLQGKIVELQQDKQDTQEVLDGRECGMMIQTSLKKRVPNPEEILYVYEHIKKQSNL